MGRVNNHLWYPIAFLRQNYLQRTKLLHQKKTTAQVELAKLYELRQTLVEKNLNGVYSDDMFKEQNALLENKMKDLMVVQDTSLLSKYSLEETVQFITNKLSDLKETYHTSLLPQKKVLLGSIFPTGMVWEYPGILNQDIGPIYQSILAFSGHDALYGRGNPAFA